MPHLNPFAISGLLIIAVSLPLFFLVLLKGKGSVSQIYLFHIFFVFLWGLGSFLAATNTNPINAVYIWTFAKIPVFFITPTLLHAVLRLTNKNYKIIFILSYVQASYFTILAFTGHIIASIKFLYNSIYYYQGTNTYFFAFVLWILIASFANFELAKHYFFSSQKSKQFPLLFLGILLGIIGGVTNFLPGFGIHIYPWGNFLIPIYFLIVSYAILRHNLLDINVVIRKSIAYSILIAFISVIYLVIVVLSEKMLQEVVGYRSLALSIAFAFLIGIIFIPLKNRIQYFVDQIFFKGTQIQIAQENELLRQELARSEKMKAVATLASGMAHEIKNPLTALKTFAEYLPQKKNDPEFLEKFSKIVGNEVSRIDGLVHQLLEFAKPSPPSLSETHINKLLDDTLSFLSNTFIKHHIEVIKEFSEDIILKIDSNQIKQALLNIILNAVEAMDKGGTLSIKTQVMSDESRATSDGSLIISIQDTGCGINPKDLPHIFDPFFSKKDSGTGLGLAITHEIVRNHGGNIRVESAVGVGTMIIIELPIRGSSLEARI